MPQNEAVCTYKAVTSKGRSVDGSVAHTRIDDVSGGVRKWTCDGEWLASFVKSWLLGCCLPLAAVSHESDSETEPEATVVTIVLSCVASVCWCYPVCLKTVQVGFVI